MSRKREESRQQWESEIRERQHNLTPADITRTSQFRASGLPKNAPLPISISKARLGTGLVLTLLGIVGGALSSNGTLYLISCLFGGTGLCLILAAVRWIEK
jgi:hypothetical protein